MEGTRFAAHRAGIPELPLSPAQAPPQARPLAWLLLAPSPGLGPAYSIDTSSQHPAASTTPSDVLPYLIGQSFPTTILFQNCHRLPITFAPGAEL